MRLWSKELIKVLPRQQLLGQVRELTAIIKDIKEKGTTNHILINKIMDYNFDHLFTYCWLIIDEMQERGYKISDKTIEKWNKLFRKSNCKIVEFKELYKDWHNEEYYQICYFNLLEKYKCGGISENEWQKIIER